MQHGCQQSVKLLLQFLLLWLLLLLLLLLLLWASESSRQGRSSGVIQA
jgi:hypothetical protein